MRRASLAATVDVVDVPMPAGILVFSTEVYLATKTTPTDFGLASTFGIVYLAITAVGIFFYLRLTAKIGRAHV